MHNLLIVLLVLFGAMFVILPLVEKTAKPLTEEKIQKMSKLMGLLMLLMAIGMVIKYFLA